MGVQIPPLALAKMSRHGWFPTKLGRGEMDRKLLESEIRVEVSDGESCQKVVSVEIARKRFEDEKTRVLGEMAKEVSFPGFRKGKVPIEIVERRFTDEIRSEALRSILPMAYSHVVSSENLDPVGDPEFHDVSLEDDKPLTFKFRVEVLPRLELADYRGVAVPAEDLSVRDEEIEAVLESLRERSADHAAVDRPAAAGDVLTIEFAPVGRDGAAVEKQRTKNYPVQLGAGQIFPSFEEALTGKKAGETGRVDVAYPADYESKRVAGRTVTYEFAVNEVRDARGRAVAGEFVASSISAETTNISGQKPLNPPNRRAKNLPTPRWAPSW